MELSMTNGFCELSHDEMEMVDGGFKLGAFIGGVLLGAVVVVGCVALVAATGGVGAAAMAGGVVLGAGSATSGGLVGYGLSK